MARDAKKYPDLHDRFDQAMLEIADEGVFSRDQIVKLHNAMVMVRWGIEESLNRISTE